MQMRTDAGMFWGLLVFKLQSFIDTRKEADMLCVSLLSLFLADLYLQKFVSSYPALEKGWGGNIAYWLEIITNKHLGYNAASLLN